MMPDINLLFGPILIGVFLNMILYGVLLAQMYQYYVTYRRRDAPWIKYLIYYLFVMETFNTAADMSIIYQPLVTNFGRPEATTFFPTMFAAQPVMVVAVSTPIQLFFAWRIWLLTNSILLVFIVFVLAMVSLGGGICTTVFVVKIDLLFSRKPETTVPALVWFLSACAADVVIAGVLVVALSRRKTGFAVTDDAITRIIRTTVQTGLLTAFFAIFDVVFFLSLPDFTLNFVYDLALAKLYSNCVMSSLNARPSLRPKDSVHLGQEGPSSSGSRGQNNTGDIAFISPTNGLGTYEMDARSALAYTPSDMEYGEVVTVTKIVETKLDPMGVIQVHKTPTETQ